MATVEGYYILCAFMSMYMHTGECLRCALFPSLGSVNYKQFCWVMPQEGSVFLGCCVAPFTHKPCSLLNLH